MWYSFWLRNLRRADSARRAHAPACGRASFRPRLEVLESRWVPSTLTVMNNLDSGLGSLRADIAAAKSGDTIDLSNLGGQTIALTGGELVINKSLTIQGAASAPVTINAGRHSRVFEVDGSSTNVTLSGLTITGGSGQSAPNTPYSTIVGGIGGGIYNLGTLTVSGCTLINNQAGDGGGIFNQGTLTVNGSSFSRDSAYANGGGIYNGGSYNSNGVFFNGGTLTVNGGSVNGTAFGHGGGISNYGSATIDSCTVSGTVSVSGAVSQGGGIYNYGTLAVNGGSVSGSATYGGGIYNATSTPNTITGCNVTGTATYGGGIYNAGTLTVSACTMTGKPADSATYGGGIYNIGTLTLGQTTLSGYTATMQGGGIYNAKTGKLKLLTSVLLTNHAPFGADLFNLGSASISKDSTVGVTGP